MPHKMPDWVVGNAIWGGGVNNILIECIYGIIVVKKMLGNLLEVGVETNAEKALLGLNLLNKFYSVHIFYSLII